MFRVMNLYFILNLYVRLIIRLYFIMMRYIVLNYDYKDIRTA